MSELRGNVPPLLGDGKGRFKIQIIGNSGTGKSTVGAALATLLGIPYISLDRLNWGPGWRDAPPDEFADKIREAMDSNENGWIIEGNYFKKGGNIVFTESTDVIWLDPPLMLYYPRVIIRTFLRLFGLRAPCSPGCPESFREVFFSRQSILWYCLSQHWAVRRVGNARMGEVGLHTGLLGQRMRRLGGWGDELKAWLKDVERMMRGRA